MLIIPLMILNDSHLNCKLNAKYETWRKKQQLESKVHVSICLPEILPVYCVFFCVCVGEGGGQVCGVGQVSEVSGKVDR